MSFGYSVTDFLSVIELAIRLRKRFAQAPEEFGAISNVVTSLSNVLQEVDTTTRTVELIEWQKSALGENIRACHSILDRLNKIVEENGCLEGATPHSLKDRAIRVWKRARLDGNETHNIYSHINFQVSTLNCFLASVTSKESHLTTIGVRKLQGGMSSMQIGLEALQSSVDGVQSRVDGVQSGVSIMRADVGTTLNHMNRLQIRIDGVQTSILKQHEQESLRHNRDAAGSILSWLSQIDFADQQADLLRRRERGTGEWLLNSSKYKDWTNSRRATLFCPGPPGAGKTIMASIIIDDLCKTFRYARDIAVAYIFYNFRSEHEHQPEDILSSLTRQIIQDQPVPVEVRDLFELHKARRTRPSSNEIISTLSSVCTSFTSVFIVVDALDECRPENRDIFLSQLFDLQNKAPVNILATSRMIPEIDILFKDHEQLVIRATAEDIQRYLETRISRLPLHIRRLQGEIKTEIINAADGMFLLAQLYADSLGGKRSTKAVRTALSNLRIGCAEYDVVYSSALQRIEDQAKDARELAKQIIAWIMWGRRPISITELQHALGIEVGSSVLDRENLPDADYMVSVCAGLVTVDHESRVIRLIHYTAQEYLRKKWQHQAVKFEADIATTCLTLLSFSEFGAGVCKSMEELDARLRVHPFYDYSAWNWGHHARMGLVVNDLLLGFLRDKAKVEAAGQVLALSYEVNQDVQETATGLHLAAHFGLTKAMRVLLSDGWSPYARDGYFRTPLSWAAREGHEGVVSLLLEREVDASSQDYLGQTALCHASIRGSKVIVEELLGKQVDADVKDNLGRSPLSWAAENGHTYVVECLLATGKVSADSKNGFGITPLSWATRRGHIDVVEQLLHMGADLDSLDKRGESPLACASRGGYENVVRLLLQKGANPNFRSTDGRTGLSHAAEAGNHTIVGLLLGTAGIDPNVKGCCGRGPLLCGAEAGHSSVVKLLLNHPGVALNARDDNGWTALMAAADAGHESVVALLIDNEGVDINSRNVWNQTPLSRATRNGHIAVVKLLLRKEGIEMSSADSWGWTPLIQAARHGHDGVVETLLGTGLVNVLECDSLGRTALSWAAGRGHRFLVERLLLQSAECLASLEYRDKAGRTPLSWAAGNGHEAAAQVLLRAGALVASGDDGQAPLSFAVLNGHYAMVRLLLDAGAASNSCHGLSGWTALQLATLQADREIESLLQAYGAVSESIDFFGLKLLFMPGQY